jgi:hypothetical protein
MPISMKCSCGRALQVKDEFAGRKVRCPRCRSVLLIPLSDAPQDEEDEAYNLLNEESDEEERKVRAEPPEPEPKPERERPRRPARAEAPLPRKLDVRKKSARSRRSGPRVTFEQGWFGNVNSGVAGGVLMILIAVVWFVLGLMADRIFFYPPVLFVIGIAAIFKGMFGGE